MEAKKIQRVGRYWLATRQRPDGQWVAWAQATPIYSDSPPAEPDARVWCAVGCSRERAAAKVRRELALPPYDAATLREKRNCWLMLAGAMGLVLAGALTTEPTLVCGGIIGIVHGLYACVWLAEQADEGQT
jgi:hypothetical protein